MNNVYITGIGVMSSVGKDIKETWENILKGKVGIKPVTRFGEILPDTFHAYQINELSKKRARGNGGLGPSSALLLQTINQAVLDAKMEVGNDTRTGICVGTTMGEIEPLEDHLTHGGNQGTIGGPHVITAKLYELLKLNGPKWTITNACAAGNIALSRAMLDIKKGNADVMIVGGIDVLSWVALTGFNSLRALSPDVCRPFDKNRKGVSLGEGAGVLILESEAHARKRNFKPMARLMGFGFNSDAHHITQPDSNAYGAVKAMKDAMKMAGLETKEIGYISAHGTGTMANDLMENKAITSLFSDCGPYVSSIKGHIGHTLGAASAIEAAISVKVLETGLIPHNQNLDETDPNIQLNLVKKKPVGMKVNYVLSNSYAFGGINTSIIIGR